MKPTSKKRLHNPLLFGLKDILTEVFINHQKSDYVIPVALRKNKKWGSRDRAFISENAYEIVRNKRLILYALDLSEVDDEHSIEKMIGLWLLTKGYQNDSAFFKDLDEEAIKGKLTSVDDISIKYSVSQLLYEYVENELTPELWETELKAMDEPADVFLRTNLHWVSRNQLKETLEAEGVFTDIIEETNAGLKLLKRANLINTKAYRDGWFEIQDAGSQQIVELLNPGPETLIIDSCAGAGGKSLQLADYTGDKSQIVAMDIDEGKLEILQKRSQRNKFASITTHLIDEKTVGTYFEKADFLLIDAPCSGLGVIKRNPDAKFRLTPDFIQEVKGVQSDILEGYSKMLKKGGLMVYATCSILPSENGEQVNNFIQNNPDFTILQEKQIWPSKSGYDGFYMALIERR